MACELRPNEMALADGVAGIQRQIVAAPTRLRLADAGRRSKATGWAQRELKGRLQPALTQMNREIYGESRVERPRSLQPPGGDPRGEGRTLFGRSSR